MKRRLIGEGLAILILAVVAFAAARATYLAGPRQPFYQSEFGPAVMLALGKGFINPQMVRGDPLEAFLLEKVPVLDPNAVKQVHPVPADQLQNTLRYLLIAVGYWWGIAGIAWARLAEVVGVLHALSVVATYGLIRVFTPALPAAIGALWYAVSPLPLSYTLLFRDYSKAPFVIGAIALTVACVYRLPSTRAVVAGAAALGAVIGIGLGFRLDVVVMAPIGIASILLFRDGYPWRGLRQKAGAVAALVLALSIAAWPVVSRLSDEGSNAFHVVLLGYADWFDARLGIEPASYGLVPFYSDAYLTNMVRVRALTTRGEDVSMPSPAYDDSSRGLWLAWLRHFPADAHTRLLAAMNTVLNLAFTNSPGIGGAATPAGWLAGVFAWADSFRGFGWLVGAALVLAAAKQAPLLAVFAAALLVAVTGYPSLQFDLRHAFHLQALAIGAIVVLGWTLWVRVADAAKNRTLAPITPSPSAWLRPVVVTAIVFIAIVFLPATTLRAYQSSHLQSAFDDLVSADRTQVAVEFDQLAADRWLARWNGAPESAGPASGFAYYVAEFTADAPRSVMAVGLRYSTAPEWTACALMRTLTTSAGVARFAFPVYTTAAGVRFEGLELGSSMRHRLAGVYRVNRPWTELSIELRLAADWQSRRLYQRLVGEERLAADDTTAWISPAACAAALGAVDATMGIELEPDPRRLDMVGSGAQVRNGAIEFDSAAAAFAALVQGAPQSMAAGDALVARLWLEDGGVTVGLLKDGAYHRWEVATRPGASVIIVRAPEAGVYTPLVSSAAPGWRRTVKFTIDRFGIVPAAHPNP